MCGKLMDSRVWWRERRVRKVNKVPFTEVAVIAAFGEDSILSTPRTDVEGGSDTVIGYTVFRFVSFM